MPVKNKAAQQAEAARNIARHVAEHLQADLSLQLWDGSMIPLGRNARSDIRIVLRSPGVIRRLVLSPRLMTLFELYAAGDIEIEGGTPLEAARRWDHLKAVRLGRSIDKLLVLKSLWPFLRSAPAASDLRDAAYTGAVRSRAEEGRDNRDLIRFHYDLSNEFYALFLDPEMVYSPGYFARPDMTLEEAQHAKLKRICRRLRLKPGERLLEIGCGWGGLLCHAALHYGISAHGVTLSQEQLEFARAKIEHLGLTDRVTVELRDYRTLDEERAYDAVVQIGMFEHVGIDNHDGYFALVNRLLRPRGRYLHDAITRRPTRNLARFRKPTAYQKVITRFIFPGGELDYIGMTITNLERNGFEVHEVEAWREHYQRTLELWAERLAANREAAEQAVGATKTRLWLLYFSLFALAFDRNTCFDFQTLASKRQVGPSGLAPASMVHPEGIDRTLVAPPRRGG